MVKIYSKKDLVQANLSLDEVLSNIEECYRLDALGKVEVPNKIGVHPEYKNSFLHAMPASITGENSAVGLKWVSYYPGNSERGLEESRGLIILNCPKTGAMKSVMEGMYITFLRTVACAVVAAKKIVSEPKVLSLVGCGGLGTWSLRFFLHAFPSIEKVYVLSKRPESREAFVQENLADFPNVELVPSGDVANTLIESDLVVSSLPPTETPPIKQGLLKENSVFIPLDLKNSWDKNLYSDFDHVYMDNKVGFDLIIKNKTGIDLDNSKIHEIKELVSGSSFNEINKGISLVAVCGIASTDVFLSNYIFEKIKDKNLGVDFCFQRGME